jgi:hypothetical protein
VCEATFLGVILLIVLLTLLAGRVLPALLLLLLVVLPLRLFALLSVCLELFLSLIEDILIVSLRFP